MVAVLRAGTDAVDFAESQYGPVVARLCIHAVVAGTEEFPQIPAPLVDRHLGRRRRDHDAVHPVCPWPGVSGQLALPRQLALRLRHRPAAVFRPQRSVRRADCRPHRRGDRGTAERRGGPGGPGARPRAHLRGVGRRSHRPRRRLLGRQRTHLLPALPDPHRAGGGHRHGRLHRDDRPQAVAHCRCRAAVRHRGGAQLPLHAALAVRQRGLGLQPGGRPDRLARHTRGLRDGGQHRAMEARADPRAAGDAAGGLQAADRRRARCLRTQGRLALGRPRGRVAGDGQDQQMLDASGPSPTRTTRCPITKADRRCHRERSAAPRRTDSRATSGSTLSSDGNSITRRSSSRRGNRRSSLVAL